MAAQSFRASFQGIFDQLFTYKGTYDLTSLVDAAGATATYTVPGVALGDFVLAVSLGVDVAGISVTAYVSAANTVSVRYQNESAGTLDLASTTIRILVARPNNSAFA
jgi:hypothetical protein